MAEITAAGIDMQYWFPGLPQWVTALVMMFVLYATNMIAVRSCSANSCSGSRR